MSLIPEEEEGPEMNARLLVVKGAKQTDFELKLPTSIGRCDKATLKLPTPVVSRKHCEVFERSGELFVKDLGSANGTYVNGVKINDSTKLDSGDQLRVGPITMVAVYDSPAKDLKEVTKTVEEKPKEKVKKEKVKNKSKDKAKNKEKDKRKGKIKGKNDRPNLIDKLLTADPISSLSDDSVVHIGEMPTNADCSSSLSKVEYIETDGGSQIGFADSDITPGAGITGVRDRGPYYVSVEMDNVGKTPEPPKSLFEKAFPRKTE